VNAEARIWFRARALRFRRRLDELEVALWMGSDSCCLPEAFGGVWAGESERRRSSRSRGWPVRSKVEGGAGGGARARGGGRDLNVTVLETQWPQHTPARCPDLTSPAGTTVVTTSLPTIPLPASPTLRPRLFSVSVFQQRLRKHIRSFSSDKHKPSSLSGQPFRHPRPCPARPSPTSFLPPLEPAMSTPTSNSRSGTPQSGNASIILRRQLMGESWRL
jgi:hypothetical protein